MRRLEYEELHELVHRDAKLAWPHVLALIERNRGSADHQVQLIGDIVFSDALPDLIDDIERAFAESERFQRVIMWTSPEFGGRGGPEVDRLWKLVDEAERRHAYVREVDSLEKPPRFGIAGWWAALTGKAVIYRLRSHEDRQQDRSESGGEPVDRRLLTDLVRPSESPEDRSASTENDPDSGWLRGEDNGAARGP
ncbi:MAG: hypothetical protein IT341_03055 [Chloroflexi bacterium]|nr:hypothetical protein [Chloroflexota bacterium]